MIPLRLPRFAVFGILALLACDANRRRSPSPPPAPSEAAAPVDELAEARKEAASWRAAHLLIDLHEHIDPSPEYAARAVRIHDAVGIGLAVELSGGYVTSRVRPRGSHTQGGPGPSDFEITKALLDQVFPGRFVEYMNLDYTDWDLPDFAERAKQQIEEGHRLGAAGFKQTKALGLGLRDKSGKLIRVDDPKLDPLWKRCGELDMPVSIHVADPRAFWLPFNPSNERWAELQDHPGWWFGDPSIYPKREELLAELERVITRHPETTFVSVHFGNDSEELDWVDAQLDKHPNMLIDLAARVPEIGRQDPEKVRRFFLKHQDRILFATDFASSEGGLTLGSGGSGPPPTDADGVTFFEKHWRWLETRDKNFPHMTPIQGNWTISGIGLPASVLRKIYFENATKLLARSLPASYGTAARTDASTR
jgi:predicted TIM-barrel fold metal-dependent hydrolase